MLGGGSIGQSEIAGGSGDPIALSAGYFTLSGQSATFHPGALSLATSTGYFTLSGQSATFHPGALSLATSTGYFALSGGDCSFIPAPTTAQQWLASALNGLALSDSNNTGMGYSLAGGVLAGSEQLASSWGLSLSNNLLVSAAPTNLKQAVASVAETAIFLTALISGGIFQQAVVDRLTLGGIIIAAQSAVVVDGVSLSSAATAAWGATILAEMLISAGVQPTASFGLTVFETVLASGSLANFLAGSISEQVGISTSVLPQWDFSGSVSDQIVLSNALANSLIVSVVAEDDLVLSDVELIQMIFNSQIEDGLEVSAAYISPNNTITTWAINTRTSAVTEYSNFNFISYTLMNPRRYLAASSSGLYELVGTTDAGVPIIGSLASGALSIGDSHFTSFKAAYIGTRQAGDFVLRLIAGDGRRYDYGIRTQAMQTTRVTFGKGLRARYFKFELIAVDGHEFDLDNIEFLPIVSKRRV